MSICELYAIYGNQNSQTVKNFRENPHLGIHLLTLNTRSQTQEICFNSESKTASNSLKKFIRIKVSHGPTDSGLVTGDIYVPSGKRVVRLQENTGNEKILHRVYGIRPGVSRFFRYKEFNLWVNHEM